MSDVRKRKGKADKGGGGGGDDGGKDKASTNAAKGGTKGKDDDGDDGSDKLLMVLLVIMVIGGGVMAYAYVSASGGRAGTGSASAAGMFELSPPLPEGDIGISVVGEIPRVYYDPLESKIPAAFIKGIVDRRLPVVINDFTPVTSGWKALREWTWDSLEETFGTANTTFTVSYLDDGSTVFNRYGMSETYAGIVDLYKPYGKKEVTFEEFRNAPPGDLMYFVNPVDEILPALKADISPHDVLISRPRAKTVVNLWLGSAGVTCGAHYDGSDNLFVQIMGRKRFIVVPPTQNAKMFPYPRLHPGARQSQLDFSAPQDELRALWADGSSGAPFDPPRALETVLEAGDMLYLPPYWWHRVITEEQSVSVNVWTASAYESLFDAAARLGAPFGKNPDPAKELDTEYGTGSLHYALRIFIKFVIGYIEWDEDIKSVAQGLMDIRYKRLGDELKAKATHDFVKTCRNVPPVITSFVTQGVDPRAREVAAVFNKLNDPSLRLMFVQDWIELVSDFFVGSENVAAYIDVCLNQ